MANGSSIAGVRAGAGGLNKSVATEINRTEAQANRKSATGAGGSIVVPNTTISSTASQMAADRNPARDDLALAAMKYYKKADPQGYATAHSRTGGDFDKLTPISTRFWKKERPDAFNRAVSRIKSKYTGFAGGYFARMSNPGGMQYTEDNIM